MRAIFLACYSLSEDFIAFAFVSIQTLFLSVETYLQTFYRLLTWKALSPSKSSCFPPLLSLS